MALSAITGIGASTAPITTTTSNLEAGTQTGGIFISNTGNLTIGNVSATLTGVRATTSGSIVLTNSGNISITVSGDNIVAENGNVSVTANGIGSDIQTGGGNSSPLAAIRTVNGGDITLKSGRDVLMGVVGVAFGNVRSFGSVSIDAGRDLIVDVDSFLESATSGGAGGITVTAGRNISVLQNTLTGARIRAFGTGNVVLTTGAGGIFTLDSGAGSGVSAGGDITITADNMVLVGPAITAGDCVVLQQKTLANVINLGGADGAGTLGLTDAELDLITATDVKIGQAGGGAITITQKITLDQPLELISGAGGITETGVGALEVDDLILVTTGAATMNGDNKVKNLAASAGTDFSFRDLVALNITELTICGNKVTGLTAGGDITLIADTFTFTKGVSADCVILKRATAGAFDLGTTINDASIDNIKANVLQIGDAAADSITISGVITVAAANVPVVDLRTAQTIANTGGTLAADQLVFAAGKAVTLTGANTFGTIAGTSGGKLEITTSGKLTVGAVTNCDPVTIKGINSTGNDIVIIADDLELVEAVTAAGDLRYADATGCRQDQPRLGSRRVIQLEGHRTGQDHGSKVADRIADGRPDHGSCCDQPDESDTSILWRLHHGHGRDHGSQLGNHQWRLRVADRRERRGRARGHSQEFVCLH